MSDFLATGQAIADALSTVDDVRGYPFRPSAPKIGDAWPVIGPAQRASGDAFLVTWAVQVVVPTDDEVAARTWWSEHWPPLFYALQPVMHITTFAPAVLVTADNGTIWIFQITGTAED